MQGQEGFPKRKYSRFHPEGRGIHQSADGRHLQAEGIARLKSKKKFIAVRQRGAQ